MKNILKILNKNPKPALIEEHSGINPHKHWTMLLWFFFALVVLLIVYSFYLLYSIKNEKISSTNPNPSEITPLNEKILNNVIQSFKEKSDKENELKSNPPKIPDPSI